MNQVSTDTMPPKTTKRAEYDRVFGEIERLCRSGEPGDRLPKHTALMLDLRASERTVLRALEALHRSGYIIRRSGAGTFVAPAPPRAEKLPPGIVDGTTLVAIMQPDNSFFSRCTEVLYRHADAAGLTLLCRLVNGETQALAVPQLGAGGPLGFIVFRHDLEPLARRIQEAGHRVVLIGAPPNGVAPNVPCLHGDHEQGAYLAAHHLIALGHRRLAFAMVTEDHRHSSRWLGHRQAIQEAGGAVLSDTTLPRETVEAWEQDPARAAAYFQAPDAPTGLVVWNDHEAVRLATVLSRAGVRVPEQVSLVGYDNLPEGSLIYPQLTTIDQAIGQQLRLALRLLTQPVPPSPSHTTLVTPTLIPRGSSAAPRH